MSMRFKRSALAALENLHRRRGNFVCDRNARGAHPALRIAVLAAVALAAPAHAQERRQIPETAVFGEPASESDAAAIETFIADYRAAWAAEDADALAAMHAEDVEWINAYARIIRGREALRTFMADRMFPGFSPEVSREDAAGLRLISTRYLGDDAAVVHMYGDSARGAARNEGESLRRVHMHFVLEKQQGAWRIAHMAIMDAR
jgi:uncharacterized protein (TIGR02246 family)